MLHVLLGAAIAAVLLAGWWFFWPDQTDNRIPELADTPQVGK